jgi:Family of unknown function (DUF5670)
MARRPRIDVCSSEQPSSAACAYHRDRSEATIVLSTIVIVLVVMWLLGMVTSYTLGGFIHILLVIAIIMVLLRIIQGRNPI